MPWALLPDPFRVRPRNAIGSRCHSLDIPGTIATDVPALKDWLGEDVYLPDCFTRVM